MIILVGGRSGGPGAGSASRYCRSATSQSMTGNCDATSGTAADDVSAAGAAGSIHAASTTTTDAVVQVVLPIQGHPGLPHRIDRRRLNANCPNPDHRSAIAADRSIGLSRRHVSSSLKRFTEQSDYCSTMESPLEATSRRRRLVVESPTRRRRLESRRRVVGSVSDVASSTRR